MNNNLFSWELNAIDLNMIEMAFLEDLGNPLNDATTELLFPDLNRTATSFIINKHPESIILAGLPVVKHILKKLDPHCEIHSDYHDGQRVEPGATLLTLTGSAKALLMSERIMLNFLQHLCAIATLTEKFVARIHHTQAKILDTRKTIPGFRHLDKYAVQCGGGVNHRMGLYDAIMVKDTHIDALGGIELALAALPDKYSHSLPVIVEVRTLEELIITLSQGLQKVTRVLLDNMSPALMHECVILCKDKLSTEASGNVDLDTVKAIAESGVEFISIGKLTHSAGNVDLSMKSDLLCKK